MPAPTKASEIDLSPIPGKQYFSLTREWREEFIYFLLIDRFHDDPASLAGITAGPHCRHQHAGRFLWRQDPRNYGITWIT